MSDIDDLASRMRAEAERAQRRFDGQNTLAFNQHDVLALLADRDRLAAEVERLRARPDRNQISHLIFNAIDWAYSPETPIPDVMPAADAVLAALATPAPTAPERDERAIRADVSRPWRTLLAEAYALLLRKERIGADSYRVPLSSVNALAQAVGVLHADARAAAIEGGAPPVNTEDDEREGRQG